ncbi:hypothetical protein Leryth_008740 [Lithospermum erythrorhizon]|nr:hypothetical protein Leryth_008740 [Lithospermum erythrorhizon]
MQASSRLRLTIWQRYQHLLDKTTPLIVQRWMFLMIVALIYGVRVNIVKGFYIITYALGIYIIQLLRFIRICNCTNYIMQLLIAFLSPQVDPADEGLSLPTRGDHEFRPFVRRLPEFKFWHSLVKAICIAFVLTFFSAFDVPVFWPILLFYWLVLFISTMKRQIMHMIKHKYVPFTLGKQRYTGKKASSSADAILSRP